MYIFILPLFTLMCIGTLFISSSHFIDSQLMPKWLIMIGGIVIIGIYYCTTFFTNFRRYKQKYETKYITNLIIASTFFQALYGLSQYINFSTSNNIFQVTGSFDNPSGFAASLCIAFPFYLHGITKSKNISLWIVISITVLLMLSVTLSESRSGILSLLIILFCWGIQKIKASLCKKLISLSLIFLIAITGLYFIKKDSANGRLLIWKCTVTMLQQNWLTGYGTGGFEAHYMDYQAAYFEKHPKDSYSILAGNVQHPFCEYLRIVIDYGIIGLLLLFGWLSYLFFCYFKYPSEMSKTALLCWVAICTFSCFSYPLMYPFVWLILIYSTFILIQQHMKNILKYYPLLFIKAVAASYMIFSIYIGYKVYVRIQAEMEWTHIANLSLMGKAKDVLPKYEKLKKTLGNDRYFLYNYSAELFKIKHYQKSIVIAMECRKYWADYDVEMLLGEIQNNLKDFERAKNHYQLASLMCPNRFRPLYKLFLLYKKTRDYNNMKEIAEIIIKKPIKIDSGIVIRIKQDVKKTLETLY